MGTNELLGWSENKMLGKTCDGLATRLGRGRGREDKQYPILAREAWDKRQHLALLVWFPKFPRVNLFLINPRLVLNMIFYGIMLYVPGLAGNMYLNIFLMFVSDLPHTPMAWVVFK